MSDILKEAEALYKTGMAIHWVKPQSKAPVESAWTTGPRKPWSYLKETYRRGYNLGVRTGSASKLKEGFLTCIDVDVKEPSAKKDALNKLKEIVDGYEIKHFGWVESGSGNGSRHLYCVSPSPFKMLTVAKEPGFEICIYSEGRQMVLPPSIHPSGRTYEWRRPINGHLPVFDNTKIKLLAQVRENSPQKEHGSSVAIDDSTFKHVELDWLPISDEVKDNIKNGTNVLDRSAYLLPCVTSLYSVGLSRDEILSVLTDSTLFMGRCAYDHAQTKSRTRAAEWLDKYTVQKVLKERDPANVFRDAPPIERALLDDVASAAQSAEIGPTDWRDNLQRSAKGQYTNSLHNTHLILTKTFGDKLFRFNDFAKVDEVWEPVPWGSDVGSEFKERDVQRMRLWFSHEYGFEPGEANVWSAITIIADNNLYHPVREYLNSLPSWDGVPRVDHFIKDYLKGEGPDKYLSAVSRKTLVAMVARIFEPGRKFDTMLVIEGKQGLRKSTAVMVLAGKKWFSDVNLNLKNKDSISDISGKWVVEQGEMQVMSKHDVKELKQFLSRDTDRMRPSYGRKSQDYPRQMIFIGTTNEDIYLKDTTGSRRFWPVKINENCDVGAIARDRDQIFAEAMTMYRNGEPLWIDNQETEHLAHIEREGREVVDELTTVISEWLEKREKESNFDDNFDPNELPLLPLFGLDGPLNSPAFRHLQADMNGQKRVADCLRKLGYERKSVRKEGKIHKLWVKLPVNSGNVTRTGNENNE